MKRFLLFLWQRRWCRLLGVGVLACSAPLFHPYTRQSLIGPQIDGIPWWVYEDEIRSTVHGEPSWFSYLAIGGDPMLEPTKLWPLYIQLAEDRDPKVRLLALKQIDEFPSSTRPTDLIPIFRRHLKEKDPDCCMMAASGLLSRNAHDSQVADVLLPLCRHDERRIARRAATLLTLVIDAVEMKPEYFDTLARLTDDVDADVRVRALESMGRCGARGLPVLRRKLRARNYAPEALGVVEHMGKDAIELVPDVLALTNVGNDPEVRSRAAKVLTGIDPARFPGSVEK